jgi:hypothetical protein
LLFTFGRFHASHGHLATLSTALAHS